MKKRLYAAQAAAASPTSGFFFRLLLQYGKTAMFSFCFVLVMLAGGQGSEAQPSYEEVENAVVSPEAAALYNRMERKNESFYSIAAAATDYVAAHPEDQSFARKFHRWQRFWNSRVDANGNMNAYQGAVAWIDQNPICATGGSGWQQVGPVITATQNSGYVRCVHAPPAQNPINVVYAGSNSGGLWKTTNFSNSSPTWTCITDVMRRPGLGVNDLLAVPPTPNDPDPDLDDLYIATGNSMGFFEAYGIGVWKTTNGGNTWQPTALDATMAQGDVIERLFFDPSVPNHQGIYAIGRKHIWKTSNSGGSWTEIPLPTGNDALAYNETINGVEIVAGNLLVATQMDWLKHARILRTNNNGTNWNDISPQTANDFTNPALLTQNFYGDGERYFITTVANQPNKLYAMFRDYNHNGTNTPEQNYGLNTYASYDFAATPPKWTIIATNQIAGGGIMDYFAYGILVNPVNNNVVYGGKVPFYKSANGGVSFSSVNSGHDDVRDIQLYAATATGAEDVLIVGNDGGVSLSTNGGGAWTNKNGATLILTQFYDISNSSQSPGRIIGGAQDNHCYKLEVSNLSDPAANNSITFSSGDGGHNVIDINDPNIAYVRANGSLFKFSFPNTSLTDTPIGLSSTLSIVNTIGSQYEDFLLTAHPSQSNILYFAKHGIFKKLNGNLSYPASVLSTNDLLTSFSFVNYGGANCPVTGMLARGLAAAPSDGRVVYLVGDIAFDTDPNPNVQNINYGNGALFRSPDEGTTWTAKSVMGGRINAVVVDPRNPDHVYISKGGFSQNNNVAFDRVYESTNAGETWTDISTGLPPFPVNALIYVKGSNGVLYAGTDVGVYHYNPATETWACFNQGLPVCMVTDLEIDYCQRVLQIATFGRGIWQAPLQNQDIIANSSIDITQNTTYDSNTITNATGNIVVKADKTLTIKSTLKMPTDAYIIVEPSATLVLEGPLGKITTDACMWGGIKVLGNKNLGQDGAILQQGRVIMVGAAKIERANNAISTWNGTDPNTAGGIVQATGATFENNRRDIEFMQYDNFYGGISHDNLSYFNNCTFQITTAYNANNSPAIPAPKHRVTMWDVKGIAFNSCTFRDSNTHPSDDQHNFYGIYSIDAGYRVEGLYNASNNTVSGSSFENLLAGIYAAGATGDKPIRVKYTRFLGNTGGIVLNATDNTLVVRNDFELNNLRNSIGIGMMVLHSTDYQIQKNRFLTNTNLANKSEIGLWLHHNGPNSNYVFKNDFQRLDRANLIWGDNRAINGDADPIGLHYECNTQSQNTYDMYIDGGNGVRPIQSGIQGINPAGITQSAQNTYSRNGTAESDYYLHSGLPVTQFYDPANINTQALDFTTAWFTQTSGSSNSCPDQANLLQDISPAGRLALAADFTQSETDYINALYLYDALMDNGNTQMLLDNIDLEWSDDAWTLRNQLVAKSPNLSQTVLRRAAASGTLPDAMLMEILLLNADACKDKAFLYFLANEIPNPLPQNLLDLLLCTQEPGSLKKTLQSNLSNYRNLMLHRGQWMLSNLLNDSLLNVGEWQQWLQRQHTAGADYSLAESYLQQNNGAAGKTLLEDMPNRYAYTARHAAEHAAYLQLFGIKRSLRESGRNYLQLSAAEKSQLQSLVNSTTPSLAATQAQNILCFVEGGSYCNFPALPNITPNTTGSGKQWSTDPQADINRLLTQVMVYPNPAQDYLTFGYEIPSQAVANGGATLLLLDTSGKTLQSMTLAELQGEKTIDTRSMPDGLYYYSLLFGKEQLASGSFSVVHQ